MTNTKHTQTTRRNIALGAAVGLVLIAGIAVRVDAEPQPQRSHEAVIESNAIAEWARAEGMAGLSPASLSTGETGEPDLQARIQLERTAIAEWARANGMTGLSPASMAPIARCSPRSGDQDGLAVQPPGGGFVMDGSQAG